MRGILGTALCLTFCAGSLLAHREATSHISGAPLRTRELKLFATKPGLCTPGKAREAQLVCARHLQIHLRTAASIRMRRPRAICRPLSRYYSCRNAQRHRNVCESDAVLGNRMRRLNDALSMTYRELCFPGRHGISAVKKPEARRSLWRQGDATPGPKQTLDAYDTVKSFFACGLLFNEIASRQPNKEKMCRAYKEFDNCTITLHQHCRGCEDLFTHVNHVKDVLLAPYDDYCRGFVPRDSDGGVQIITFRPLTPGPSTPVMTAPPPKCDENVHLGRYFECGVMYIFNLRDAFHGDFNRTNREPCSVLEEHKACLRGISQMSHCSGSDTADIQANLDYVDSQLRASGEEQCSTSRHRHSGKRLRFEAAQPRCHVREYAGSYFTCGTIFIQRTYPKDPPIKELCKHFQGFRECVGLLIMCRTQSDITPAFNYFTEQLTKGLDDQCSDVKILLACDKMTFLNKFFSCGIDFHQQYAMYTSPYTHNKPPVCKPLDDFNKCIKNFISQSDCKDLKIKALFENFEAIRRYNHRKFNLKERANCAEDSAGSRSSRRLRGRYSNIARQSSCDQLKAIRRIMLCGVAFHRMLTPAENNSRAVVFSHEVCPLVDEMKKCVRTATIDSGCSGASHLSASARLVQQQLLNEYDETCGLLAGTLWANAKRSLKACELEKFVQDWESCDLFLEDSARVSNLVSSDLSERKVSIPVQKRLCKLKDEYRQCLGQSADRRHCPGMASQVADMGDPGPTLLDKADCY
ncbi:uncharacterized protein LOC144137913 [Haemaphysalis longicornis]